MSDSRTLNYLKHYELQNGGALNVYAGQRFQKGGSWFSKLIGGVGSFFKSLLPGVGRSVLPSAVGLAQDLVSGENFKDSSLKRLKEAGKSAANETLDQLKARLQGGQGISRIRSFHRHVLKRPPRRRQSKKRKGKKSKLF